ncbi:MAG: hypothetical protein QOD02_4550 [Mycobacterium sp.]|jgi:hypothetical protein|nr:hypothetical protein [Mycobacterium sp.]
MTQSSRPSRSRDRDYRSRHHNCDGSYRVRRIRQHYKSSVLAMKLVRDTDLSLKQSGYFIGVAVSAYCPQYAGRTDTSANFLNPGPALM